MKTKTNVTTLHAMTDDKSGPRATALEDLAEQVGEELDALDECIIRLDDNPDGDENIDRAREALALLRRSAASLRLEARRGGWSLALQRLPTDSRILRSI